MHVCDEVIAGKWDEHFPLVVFQTGSGTQVRYQRAAAAGPSASPVAALLSHPNPTLSPATLNRPT